MQTKSAKTSNLIFFNSLLMLAICSPEDDINLEILSLPMGIITCLLDGSLVVMLIWSFFFLGSLIVLWISLIFFEESLENKSLILKISLILVDNVCAYNCLFLLLLFSVGFIPLLWWYFDFAKLLLKSLERTEDSDKIETLARIKTCFFFSDFLLGYYPC